MKIVFCAGFVQSICDFCESVLTDTYEIENWSDFDKPQPVPDGQMCDRCKGVFLLNVQAAGFISPPPHEGTNAEVHSPEFSSLTSSPLPSPPTTPQTANGGSLSSIREASHLIHMHTLSEMLTVILFEGRPDDPELTRAFVNACCQSINAAKLSISESPEHPVISRIISRESPSDTAKRATRENKKSRFKKAFDELNASKQNNNPAAVAAKIKRN